MAPLESRKSEQSGVMVIKMTTHLGQDTLIVVEMNKSDPIDLQILYL